MALHYHHAHTILPRDGAMLYAWYTNLHKLQNRVPLDVIKDLRGMPEIRRQKIDLGGQFSYRFGVEPTQQISAFFVTLGEPISIFGTAIPHPKLLDIPPEKQILQPFQWPAISAKA